MDSIKDLRRGERRKYDNDYYEHHYWAEDLPGRAGNRGLSYDDPDHTARFTFLAGLIRKHFSFACVLDAGAGPGLLSDRLRGTTQARVIELDVSLAAFTSDLRKNRGNLAFVSGVEELPLRERSCDLVLCLDVLEHVPFFDVQAATRELARVAREYLVLTINTDNPYYFHPTILSRETWITLFLRNESLVHAETVEAALQADCTSRYSEYDFFVFRRV